MKTILCALAMFVCMMRLDAADLNSAGKLTWEIDGPQVTFKLDGVLENNSAEGTVSGPIKLVLWGTALPFPSPGFIVADYDLTPLEGGDQFSDFSHQDPAQLAGHAAAVRDHADRGL